MEFPYKFELCNVIMRKELSVNLWHNYAVCKENDIWVVYNDSSVLLQSSNILDFPCIFMFKVSLIRN